MTLQSLLLVTIVLIALLVGIYRWQITMRTQLKLHYQERCAEEKRRLIMRLDHELKNPLTAIRINLANLGVAIDDENREQIHEIIQEQVLRLSDLVTNLRKLANLDTGAVEFLPIKTVNFLKQIVSACRRHPQARHRKLVLPSETAGKDFLPIKGDKDLLQLAVYNLIDNAMKFTKSDDVIMVWFETNNDELTIGIQDSGMGIPESDLPFISEELYRSKTAHGIPGSGLGLATVKTIIDLHGGRVEYESEAGQGTTARLILPLQSA